MSGPVVPLVAGHKIGEWTLLELKTDASSARERRWLIQCSCGCKALRAEHHLRAKTHAVVCGSCAKAAIAAKAHARAVRG